MSSLSAHHAMRKFSQHALLLAALSIVVLPAAAGPLSLADAQRAALAISRQSAAQQSAASAARELAVAAAQLPDPMLSIGVDNLPVSGTDRFRLSNDFMTMRRIGISQELTRSDKRQMRAQRYEREADKSTAQRTLVQAEIARETALAWLERYYAERTMALLGEQLQLAREEVGATDSAYRGGRSSQAALLAANSTVALLEDRLSSAQRRVRAASAVLTRWTGIAPDENLAAPPATDRIPLTVSALENELAQHPQIAVLRRQEEMAEAEANLAKANRRSDWTVELSYQQRGGGFSNMVSFGLSVPLQWDRPRRQDRELAASLANVDKAHAERDEQLRAHVAETRVLIEDWENGRERLARYAGTLLPLASQRTSALLAAYRGGKGTLSELLLARREEGELRLQQLDLQSDTDRLWARITYLIPDQTITEAPMAQQDRAAP